MAWPFDGVAATRQSGSKSLPDAARRNAFRSLEWAISELIGQGMPHEEIAGILGGDDPKLAHRYLELHRERLAERLMDQRRIVGRIEALVTEAIRQKRASPRIVENVRSARNAHSTGSSLVGKGRDDGSRQSERRRQEATRAVEHGHVLRTPVRRVVNMESSQGGPR